MITLKGNNIFLRALEPEDLEFIHAIENDESIWEMSNTQTPKDTNNRLKGYGREALKLLINYAFSHLDLKQLYCNISEENDVSIKLFSNQGFKKIGLKKDWNFVNGAFKNEYLFQLINN